MIIGLDIDDTISRHPEFFSVLSRALVEGGHAVIILTVRQDRDDAERQLREWGIAYGRLVTYPPDRPPLDVVSWKTRRCAELSIEILFEDSTEVVQGIDHGRTLCMVPADPRSHEWLQ